MKENSIIWFRKDLRLQDNLALIKAAEESKCLIPIYIFEDHEHGAANKWWLHHSLIELEKSLNEIKLPLILLKGDPIFLIPQMIRQYNIAGIYWNRCYEPYAIKRDTELKKRLAENNINAKSYNSSLLFEPFEIQNNEGNFFKVFTPFWKKCLSRLGKNHTAKEFRHSNIRTIDFLPKSLNIEDLNLLPTKPDWAEGLRKKWLGNIGEKAAAQKIRKFIETKLDSYPKKRDFPSQNSTSELSPHLHFGEIGPRQIYTLLMNFPEENHVKFLSEIGWREFAYNLLYHFPDLPSIPFQKKYEDFNWRIPDLSLKDPDLEAWKYGNTSCPIIDAGMKELTATGFMHNRVRMLVASFLTKDLNIHWKIGAKWFFDRLVDADLANNSASWQWVAGCGADAAPYFRKFNPILQAKKFDSEEEYVKKWIQKPLL
jgi:deoxyribodipyrimidine photo-lyase